jgi:radical SAM superfamily enzyme YgiQ (UPF0313 family)
VLGNPDETEEDIRKTFRFASKLKIDSFGFNRLCVYRGTPLWKEYVKRGLVNDDDDWYKYYKCSEIDPTVLPGEVVHRLRNEGFKYLIRYKLTHYPIQSLRILKRLSRNMRIRDVLYLIVKPFLGKKEGATKAEVLSRAVEHERVKDAAGELTRVADGALEGAVRDSRGPNA